MATCVSFIPYPFETFSCYGKVIPKRLVFVHQELIPNRLQLSRSANNPSTIKCSDRNPVTHNNGASVECSGQPSRGNRYHPRIWEGRDFISDSMYNSQANAASEERLKRLKREMKNILSSAANDPLKELSLVDKIQQLGVGYHFEAEIEDILQRTYNDHSFDENVGSNLYYDALRFRLLRQAGFYLSTDIFKKYKDEKGEFCKKLASDVQGLLSLYEATYLSLHGEHILEEAMTFTVKHLNSVPTTLGTPLASQVQRALYIPLHHGVERVHARHYISIYGEDPSRHETLLEFAKLDFNFVQLFHKRELIELSRWWDKIVTDVKAELPFQFRDRMAEGYIICMGTNSEPQFSLGRIHVTKMWYAYTIFDDAQDEYEDPEELRPLRDALMRWDDENLDELADHMKVVFHQMKNCFKEIEEDMIVKQQIVGIPYLKKTIQGFMKPHYEEAKLMCSSDPPAFKAWLSLSSESLGLDSFLVAAVMNLGEVATKEVFEWIDSKPQILTTFAMINRLLDDIADYKREKDLGILKVSTVTCYMNDYGVSEEDAIQSLKKMTKILWKDMNKILLRPTPVPRSVINLIFGIVRIISEFYSAGGGDGYTESEGRTKELVAALLRDPIPI